LSMVTVAGGITLSLVELFHKGMTHCPQRRTASRKTQRDTRYRIWVKMNLYASPVQNINA